MLLSESIYNFQYISSNFYFLCLLFQYSYPAGNGRLILTLSDILNVGNKQYHVYICERKKKKRVQAGGV
ncbi:hypothetical protein RchiOBHm_Chr0c22g0500481 [Rosa chinensis]|uniref:Uncharacterized protein n=1 Tax=Rosa chinensis TaxID=74649 RepID=A0A2P6SQG1_ROSCH|nr:hypothetical protein RchiOBHm_Chr0c22g0500481 [Rosa chinensis]